MVIVTANTVKSVTVLGNVRAAIERGETEATAPRPLSADTDPRAEAVQMDILRRMTPAEKIALVVDANRCTEELVMAGLRMRHTEAGPDELRRRLLELLLGHQLHGARANAAPRHDRAAGF